MWCILGTRRVSWLVLREPEEVWQDLKLERWVLVRSFMVLYTKLRTLILKSWEVTEQEWHNLWTLKNNFGYCVISELGTVARMDARRLPLSEALIFRSFIPFWVKSFHLEVPSPNINRKARHSSRMWFLYICNTLL